jgi:hypothetical protein
MCNQYVWGGTPGASSDGRGGTPTQKTTPFGGTSGTCHPRFAVVLRAPSNLRRRWRRWSQMFSKSADNCVICSRILSELQSSRHTPCAATASVKSRVLAVSATSLFWPISAHQESATPSGWHANSGGTPGASSDGRGGTPAQKTTPFGGTSGTCHPRFAVVLSAPSNFRHKLFRCFQLCDFCGKSRAATSITRCKLCLHILRRFFLRCFRRHIGNVRDCNGVR